MNQQLGQYNQKHAGGNRFVTALVTEAEHDLAMVYIDDRVVLETAAMGEYRYFIANDKADIEQAKESFREAASRLGFDPGVEAYIGEVQRDSRDTHDDGAGRGAAAGQPRDAAELAGAEQGPAVCPGGPGDSLPPERSGSVGTEELSFDDLIDEGDIFS